MPAIPAATSLTQAQDSDLVSSPAHDPFETSTGPIVYMSENRIPVMLEFQNVIIYVIFAALISSLLLLLPALRRAKLTTFISITTLLLMGASIMLALSGSHWLTGKVHIKDFPYKARSQELIDGELSVNVGLSWTNVSLMGDLVVEGTGKVESVNLNERFDWSRPDSMVSDHLEALRRGLPYPILSVTDFLSQDSEGFNWVRQLRAAGYCSSLILQVALVSWSLTLITMCALPSYLPHMIQGTGALSVLSTWAYAMLIGSPKKFSFHVSEGVMEFDYGITFLVTLASGSVSILAGVVLFVMQQYKPNKRLTAMDSDGVIQDQKYLQAQKLPQYPISGILNISA